MGKFWDRSGQNEIDIVACDKKMKNIFMAECKLAPRRVTKNVVEDLIRKSNLGKFRYFRNKYLGIISFEEIDARQRVYLNKRGVQFFNASEIFEQ